MSLVTFFLQAGLRSYLTLCPNNPIMIPHDRQIYWLDLSPCDPIIFPVAPLNIRLRTELSVHEVFSFWKILYFNQNACSRCVCAVLRGDSTYVVRDSFHLVLKHICKKEISFISKYIKLGGVALGRQVDLWVCIYIHMCIYMYFYHPSDLSNIKFFSS